MTHLDGGYAACDGVVVSAVRSHLIVVLILYGVGVDGNLSAESLKRLRQLLGPENGKVRFRSRVKIVESVQHSVGILGHPVASVVSHSGKAFGYPHRVAAEELVVLVGSQVSCHPQLENEVVHKLLNSALGVGSVCKVTFCVYVYKCRRSAERHCGAVFFLDSGKVSEVGPLNGLPYVLCRL